MTERLTDEALRACPFCGGEADTMTPEADDMRAATVMCMGCYCTGKECETEAQAIAAWNRRATPADDLRAAAHAIVDHELFYDREYLSEDLNEKLDALRAALSQNGGAA